MTSHRREGSALKILVAVQVFLLTQHVFSIVSMLYCRQLFILEHHFRFPYLTEGVRHGLSKRSFPGIDRHRSQLGCNDPRV